MINNMYSIKDLVVGITFLGQQQLGWQVSETKRET